MERYAKEGGGDIGNGNRLRATDRAAAIKALRGLQIKAAESRAGNRLSTHTSSRKAEVFPVTVLHKNGRISRCLPYVTNLLGLCSSLIDDLKDSR